MNNRELPIHWFKELQEEEECRLKNDEKRKKYNFLDLFRTPSIRKRTFAVFFSWPICSMLYYGISMNSNFLGGDLYWTFIFGGLSEIPASILTYFLLDKIGRKAVLVGGFFIASLTMISSLIVDKDCKLLYFQNDYSFIYFSPCGCWDHPISVVQVCHGCRIYKSLQLHSRTLPYCD